MADTTIHSEIEPSSTPISFSQTARACGIKVAISFLAIGSLLAVIGKAIEQREALSNSLATTWGALLWAISLGGHFWGSVIVGCTALSVIAWSSCVSSKLPDEGEEKAKTGLLWVSVAAAVLWLFANRAMQTTFVNIDDLTVYRQIAAYLMNAPYVVGGIALFGSFFLLFESDE